MIVSSSTTYYLGIVPTRHKLRKCHMHVHRDRAGALTDCDYMLHGALILFGNKNFRKKRSHVCRENGCSGSARPGLFVLAYSWTCFVGSDNPKRDNPNGPA